MSHSQWFPAYRSFAFGAISLSGLAAPVGMMFLLGRGAPTLSLDIVQFTNQLLYLSALGVTVAKVGLDSWAFARLSADPTFSIPYGRFVLPLSFGAALIFAAVCGLIFSSLLLFGLLSLSIPLDACSAVRSSEGLARNHYGRVILGSLLNMPTFVGLLIVLGLRGDLSASMVAICFFLTSSMRCAALFCSIKRVAETKSPLRVPIFRLGFQQVLNYLLFRFDAVAVVFLIGHFQSSTSMTREMQYYMRFVELSGGGAALFTMLILPYSLKNIASLRIYIYSGWAFCVCTAFGLVEIYYQDSSALRYARALYVLSALLSFPATLCSQKVMANGGINTLVNSLFVSIAAGFPVVVLSIAVRAPAILTVVVPLQLIMFLFYTKRNLRRSADSEIQLENVSFPLSI